jgi:tetratricopeptide (TPR) repeat protein
MKHSRPIFYGENMQATIQQLDQAIAQGQVAKAISLGESLVQAWPKNQHVALSLSEAYRMAGETGKARAAAKSAYAIDPAFPFAQAQFLRCLMPFAEHHTMMTVLEKALAADCRDPWCLQVFSDAAIAIDEWSLAREFLGQLSSHTQGVQQGQARYMQGVSFQVSGMHDQAIAALQQAASIPALAPRAYWSMVSLDSDSVSDNALETLLQSESMPGSEKRYVWQSLGQKKHLAGEHAAAFKCWQSANQLSLPLHRYSHSHWERFFEQLKQGVASPESFLQDSQAASHASPIFVVGLPRSGSTLLEQLLVASGRVQALGELRDLEVIVQEVLGRNIRPMPMDVTGEDWRQVAQSGVAQQYQARIASRCRPDMIPCDKNPANVLWLGVILRAWPDAKIIHVHKTPEAACLGAFRQIFAAAAPWSYQLEDIAHYYRHTQSLLQYWHQQYPGRILDVSYEAFVTDPVAEGRRVFGYLGLPWHDAVVEGVGQQSTNIPTASSSQVRAGVHQGYLHAWEAYQQSLEPFTKAIA